MADPRGRIEKQGGTVIGTVALTGKPHSAKLNPTKEQLRELRDKHGREFEKWWRTKFGHAFNCLTQSEARYLARSPDVDTIRDRLAAAERQGDRAGSPGSHREQDRRPKELKSYRPPTPRRPVPTRWQGYGRPPKPAPDPTPQTVFDPHIIVLTIKARRVSLPATLKLTMRSANARSRRDPLQGACGRSGAPRSRSVPRLWVVPTHGRGPASTTLDQRERVGKQDLTSGRAADPPIGTAVVPAAGEAQGAAEARTPAARLQTP